ncbi:hypothetical protein CK203_026471 [Vitis vinifera]|uniref:GAG-pre-integrase domain-containing protein n=1 Tax=Vitis vinifera TaxID=29760 RepID=A0A438IVI6_VITVI|nr:hypothetical protein CK203_026471 [Vitis vinifera]
MPCLLSHQIIKILGSLTLVQTHHLSHSAQTLFCVHPYSGTDQVTIGDGNSLPILHTVSPNSAWIMLFSFEFHSSYFFVKDQVTKKILLKGWLRDGLYEFSSSSPPRAFVTISSFSDGAIWHSRLGHPAALILLRL